MSAKVKVKREYGKRRRNGTANMNLVGEERPEGASQKRQWLRCPPRLRDAIGERHGVSVQ